MCSVNDFDDFLNHFLLNEGSINNFFDKIFDFLYRRTDFFKIKTDDSQTVGLPKGEAENIVKTNFCEYMNKYILEQTCNSVEECILVEDPQLPEYVQEEVVETSVNLETIQNDLPLKDNPVKELEKAPISKRPEDETDVKIPLMDPDSYNGANHDIYSWSQTLLDVDIRIKVPNDVSSGKQVLVSIRPSYVSVKILSNGEWSVVKAGDLPWKVNVEESTWTLIPKEYIHVCLQKLQERWWDCAWVGEHKINLREIDSSIPYEQLDSDSQTKIEELMYKQYMKRIGKQTESENKLNSILKDAWNAEGSPFKGQEFDPSIINIQNSENFQL